jgi:hypothetical protein
MHSFIRIAVFAISFTEMRARSGIDFVNVSGDELKHYIVSSLGGGAALFDYDGDGDLDLYLVNGMKLVGRVREPAGGNRLYRNEGDWRFRDVSDSAGIGHEGWGVGCAAGDYDNDGHVDLYVTNIGPNVLYRNRGDGTFVEVGDATDDRFGASAAFFDADGDGDLDLYAANYVDPDLSKIAEPGSDPTCVWLGMPVMCGPRGLGGQRDVFYRNDDGRFVDATESAGLLDLTNAYGLGVVSVDYDDDGDVDLYVTNDTRPNFLYENDGSGRFTDVGLLAGVAYNASGDTEAGMGVDFGDSNGDGNVDAVVTNFSHETNTLYLGSDVDLFTDATDELGLSTPSLGRLGWAARFADFDRDGDEDLFIANGHVYPNVSEVDATTTYRQPNQVFVNDGAGNFQEQLLDEEASSRGAAFGDVDDDGDVDVVVVDIDGPPSLLRNDAADGHWMGLELVGRESNRDANGARVMLTAGGRTQLKYVHPSGSIFSSSDPRLLFGLGPATSVDEIRIRWPSGRETRLTDVRAGQYLLVIE